MDNYYISNEFEFVCTNQEEVKVLRNDKYYGCIALNLYNVLYLLSSLKSKEKVENYFKDKMKFTDNSIKLLLDRIEICCSELFTNDESKAKILPFFKSSDETLYVNRIPYLIPKDITISLTRYCPLTCNYCYANAIYSPIHVSNDILTTQVIEKILCEASSLNIKKIGLTGVDVLLRPDLWEILTLFDKYKIKTSFSTKKRLTEDEIAHLKGFKCIEDIQISLDSIINDEQEKLVNVKDYHEEAIYNVKLLIENDIPVRINSVLTKYNINNYFTTLDYLQQFKLSGISIGPYVSSLGRRNSEYFPSFEQYEEFSKKLKRYRSRIKLTYSIILKDFNVNKLYCNMPTTTCSAGIEGFLIGPDGNTAICERMLYDKQYSIGNIIDSSIIEIWNGDRLRKFKKLNLEDFKGQKCYSCKEKDYCLNERGICYIQSLILNDSLYGPDGSCRYADPRKRVI